MVTNGGVVQYLAVDNGDTDIVDTSAEKILEVLTPQASAVQQAVAAAEPKLMLLPLLLAAVAGVALNADFFSLSQ